MNSPNDSGSPRGSSGNPPPTPPETPNSSKSAPYSGERKLLDPNDVCVGCIVWLPKRQLENERLVCKISGVSLADEGYDHPVVILNIDPESYLSSPRQMKVSVAALTTFQDLPLEEFLQQRKSPRKFRYREAFPISAHSDAVPSLRSLVLERGEQFHNDKQSYVKLSNIHDVPISELRTYNSNPRSRAYKFRLDEPSYIFLMEQLGRQPENYPNHELIWEMNKSRRAKARHSSSADIRRENSGLGGLLSQDTPSESMPHAQASPPPRRSKRLAAKQLNDGSASRNAPFDNLRFNLPAHTSSGPLLPPPVTQTPGPFHHEQSLSSFAISCLCTAYTSVVAFGRNVVAFIFG